MEIDRLLQDSLIFMQCQRCGKKDGEYFCSTCNRVICSDCKAMEGGRIYCLDDAAGMIPSQNVQQPAPNIKEATQNVQQQEVKPKSFKTLKDLIYADVILLIGVVIIYYISYSIISGLIISNFQTIMQNLPQLSFVFVLLEYFTSFGLYAIIGLAAILIILIIVYIMKRR